MKISPYINLLLASTAVLSSCTTKQTVEKTRPNILYIMCDDHSYQTISAYGSEVSKLAPTPNIDRLASEGMLFDRAFVENSLSAPSRACLMTALYSHQNGQEQLCEGIDTTKTFFTELLHDDGYETGIVGKWHLMCEPKGFDYYHILDDQGKYYNPTFKSKETHGKYVQEKGYATSLITQHAIEFLDHRDKSKPFCLMVHHKAPHRNWMPEQKYLDLYEDVEFPVPATFWDDYEPRGVAAHTQKLNIANAMEMAQDLKVPELCDTTTAEGHFSYVCLMGELGRLTPEERAAWDKHYGPRNKKLLEAKLTGKELTVWKYQNYMKDYLRCIKSVDDSVGELLAYLEKEGLLDNTIIVYTSDQGFWMGEHGWFDKRFMYEESFRTPLLIRYPQAIKAGSRCSRLVQNLDFAPTLLDVAGVKVPEQMEGRSLVPLFGENRDTVEWRKSLYYHYYDYPTFHLVRRHDGVRTDRYKLIHFYGKGGVEGATPNMLKPGTRENRTFNMLSKANYFPTSSEDINYNELYDLEKDPNELNNLYGQPGYEEITKELQGLLDDYRTKLNVTEY
jgi:arylsulfatase A-like enzyme